VGQTSQQYQIEGATTTRAQDWYNHTTQQNNPDKYQIPEGEPHITSTYWYQFTKVHQSQNTSQQNKGSRSRHHQRFTSISKQVTGGQWQQHKGRAKLKQEKGTRKITQTHKNSNTQQQMTERQATHSELATES
jgi:hypothetical protein